MNRASIAQEFDAILNIVASHPKGIEQPDIRETLSTAVGSDCLRTLQRRLAALVESGRLTYEYRNQFRVYKCQVPISSGPVRRLMEPGAAYEIKLPVSAAGREIRALIRKPLTDRDPIGYDRKFLENYWPGSSQYLPDATRAHLHEIGRTAFMEQPAGTHARSILDRLRVDLSWSSSRLEGCAYTRSNVRELIESGNPLEKGRALETRMILSHKAAIELLLKSPEQAIDAVTIWQLHTLLSQYPRAEASLRPQFVEQRLHLFIEKAAAIPDPFEQAFFILAQLPYLQPFTDTNKPISRLAANIPLFKHNLCPLVFVDVPMLAYVEGTLGVYELRRIELLRDVFVWAYEQSCKRYAPDPAAIP
jgi:hypothetical protein